MTPRARRAARHAAFAVTVTAVVGIGWLLAGEPGGEAAKKAANAAWDRRKARARGETTEEGSR